MRSAKEQEFKILKPFPPRADFDPFRGGRRRKIRRIYLHCSATSQGDAEAFDYYHRVHNGWNQIGYHFVVNNGVGDKVGYPSGIIQHGRPLSKVGAHVKGDNSYTIGICLVGNWDFETFDTKDERILSAVYLAGWLMRYFDLPSTGVFLHREAGQIRGVPNPGKSCPGTHFDGKVFRKMVADPEKVGFCEGYYVAAFDAFMEKNKGFKAL